MNDTNNANLRAPYSLKVSSDNVLTWSFVKGAVAYLPNINGVDSELVTSNQLFLSDVANGGHLVIKVKAIGDGTIYQDSAWSDELEYDMVAALGTPIPVVSGKIVRWEAIDGANKYEYNINGSLVRTDATTIDLSDFPSEKYTITVRALPTDNQLNTVSAWSSEVIVTIIDRLSTPVLTVVGPSLKAPDVKTIVSWEPVELASGYDVYIDDVKQKSEGTSLDVSHVPGTFQVKVTAINPGEYDSSETAIVTISKKVYGKGDKDDPYKIYDATDWNDFVEIVDTDEGISGYLNKYIQLENDIDFQNALIKPVGKSSLFLFKGTLDGNGHTLKNAKIGEGSASHQAFFYMLNGTVKNLYFDKITVNAGGASGTKSSAAVISAGDSDVKFTIENCHVTNSYVTSAGDGSNAAGLVARCNNSDACISGCSVSSSTITAGKENVGGVLGYFGKGSIDNIVSSGNTVSGTSKVGGVVGTVDSGLLINIMSTDNISSVSSSSCGGVVGICTSDNAKIINVYSNDNTVKCINHANAPYLGLLVGGANNKKGYLVANTLTLAGTTDYVWAPTESGKNFAGAIGIVIGYATNTIKVDSCFYSEKYRLLYDSIFSNAKGTDASTTKGNRYAVGVLKTSGTNNSDGGEDKSFLAKSETELTDDTVLTSLNDWVNHNKSDYPSLKSWTVDENNYPKL